MKLYVFVLITFGTFLAMFVFPLVNILHVPQSWEEKCCSKSFFAKIYNRVFKFTKVKLDVFYEVAIKANFTIFLISLVLLLVDLTNNQIISNFLGSHLITVLGTIVLGITISYEAFVNFLWYINRDLSEIFNS